MRKQTTRRGTRGRSIVSLAAVLGLGLVLAAPAQARNEFEDAFEDQLGRMFAVEAFRLGGFILSNAVHAHATAYAAPAPVYYDDAYYGYHDRRYERPRRHWRKHKRHHRRHHRRHDDCDHGRSYDRYDHWDD